MVKKGDTLVEVTLAIGIFSMVAIGITAVISSSASGSQTALESTLAREEVDTQAEALRFIQSAYSANKGSANDQFSKIWQKISDNAIESKGVDLNYAPTSCSDPGIPAKAFVINPRALNSEGAFISNQNPSNPKIIPAPIYPRLVFGNNASTNEESLIDEKSGDDFQQAEGIYILAVKGTGTSTEEGTPPYYDFYIRACWYGSDANNPSTISTVVRLFNPDTIPEPTPEEDNPPSDCDTIAEGKVIITRKSYISNDLKFTTQIFQFSDITSISLDGKKPLDFWKNTGFSQGISGDLGTPEPGSHYLKFTTTDNKCYEYSFETGA